MDRGGDEEDFREEEMMRMLDLFCGRFGWSRAFTSRGWEVVGIDLVEPRRLKEKGSD